MGCRPRFACLVASPLARACTPLTKPEEKERLLVVYPTCKADKKSNHSIWALHLIILPRTSTCNRSDKQTWPLFHRAKSNRWFSHNVTKIQTKILSILPRFCFYDVLEQLTTNFHTHFRFKRVLGFVIAYAWISKLLRDAASTWRPRELSCRLKKRLISGNFAI